MLEAEGGTVRAGMTSGMYTTDDNGIRRMKQGAIQYQRFDDTLIQIP